jgi:hypothetical protein
MKARKIDLVENAEGSAGDERDWEWALRIPFIELHRGTLLPWSDLVY